MYLIQNLDEAKEKPMNAFHPDYTKKQKEKEGTGKFDKKKVSTGTVYTKKSEKEKPDYLDLDDDGDKEESMKKGTKAIIREYYRTSGNFIALNQS